MTLYNHVEFFTLILLICVNKGDKGDKVMHCVDYSYAIIDRGIIVWTFCHFSFCNILI